MRFVSLSVFLVGCTPVRLPHAPRSPMINQHGDVAVAASASIQGIQVDGTYAVTDLLAARIGYQTRIAKGKIYHLPTGGFGVYQSLDQWRFGAFVDVGGGYAFNRETITITSGNSTSTEVYTNAGPMFQGALTVHAGAKQKFMEELYRFKKGSITRRHFLNVTGLGAATAVMGALFALAMTALIGFLLCFLREVYLATATLRIGVK